MCYTLNITKGEQWRKVAWKKFDKQIREIQKRIYDASVRKDLKSVRSLQKVLVGLTPAKFIAVRRISQDNREKKTSILERIDLVDELKIDGQADSIRRVFIPKQKPLGIPTMRDRAKQFLLLMALEPEWEARFEPNSYGFRPGRSCEDARAAISQTLKQKAKYVFNGKIDNCFQTIAHDPLLKKINTIPLFRKQIRAWLRAATTFQGNSLGPIYPFLANIALNGLEDHLRKCLATWSNLSSNGLVVRYAYDFVILYPHLEILKRVVKEVQEWLSPLGLEISKNKSFIRHTLYKHESKNAGFQFLGIYFSHKECGIEKPTWFSNKNISVPLQYYLSQKPDRERVQNHIDKVRDIVKRMEKRPQSELIAKLNPIILGWTNYYALTDNADTFGYCDNRMFYRLLRYACNRHKSKGKRWIMAKYFHTFENRKWIFATPDRLSRLKLYSKRVG
jgi:RNA-directed DNA polymerase